MNVGPGSGPSSSSCDAHASSDFASSSVGAASLTIAEWKEG